MIRPEIEIGKETQALLKEHANQLGIPYKYFLGELILIGYQHKCLLKPV